MKYGEKFEKESVPGWSLRKLNHCRCATVGRRKQSNHNVPADNIDYNSLKYYIKVHTTKDQARAIAIPGQTDTALTKVEDELYLELCRQHDRVDLFVNAKADEINRRLQHLSDQIHRLLIRCTDDSRQRMPLKRQRKFLKLEREVNTCGDEIQDLQRFVNAQVQAFRKILKKYKKWTGSASLSSRFKDNILSHPKSFTKKDFRPLQQAYDELTATVRASTPASSEPVSPIEGELRPPPSRTRSSRQVTIQTGPPQTRVFATESPRYWNEYDDGSDAGDMEGDYAIYINHDDESNSGNGLKLFFDALTTPMGKARAWIKQRSPEHRSLLSGETSRVSYGATGDARYNSYFSVQPGEAQSPTGNDSSSTAVDTDADDDNERDIGYDGYASSDEFPHGYEAHFAALPSINDQRIHRYREKVLLFGTVGLFLIAFTLLGIATVLITAGRHKLRAEVDAGVTIGV